MKKTLTTIIAILTAGFVLLAIAACDPKEEDTGKDEAFMKAVFEDITSDSHYTEWKQMNPEADIEEKLDGNSITFTVTSELDTDNMEEDDFTDDKPVSSGEYVFTRDGDYVVYTSQDDAHMSNPFLVYVEIAILNYYGTGFVDANEYLNDHPDNTYYLVNQENRTVSIYAASKWKID